MEGLDLLALLPMKAEKFTGELMKLGNRSSDGRRAIQGDDGEFMRLDEIEGEGRFHLNVDLRMALKVILFLLLFIGYLEPAYIVLLMVVTAISFW